MAGEVLCTVADGVATVALNRPAKRNALSTALVEALAAAFTGLESRTDVRVVVVRGEGPVFCAGMDLDELSARQADAADPEVPVIEVFQQIERSRHPTVAMVQGDAFAGGCVLAVHCDLRIAADTARFCMPLARIGLVAPYPLARKLVEVAGPAATRRLLLTGTPVTAPEAFQMGLVHEVVPAAALEGATATLARTIAANAPLALGGMKTVIARAAGGRAAADDAELDALVNRVRRSADAREGVRAVLEKRRPDFRGR